MTYRRTLRAVGLGALAVLLSACIKLDMDIAVNSDDTVSGTIITGVSKDLLPMLGGEQAVRDQIQEGLAQGEIPEGVDIADYSDDQFVGVQATFEDLPLEDFNSGPGETTSDALIKHENGKFIVDTTLPLSGEEFGAGELGSAAGTGEIQVAVRFPGKVLSHNGQLDGTTVTWTGTLGEDLVMKAESEETGAEAVGGGGGGNTALWIGLGILVVAGLAGFFLYRRSRAGAPAAAAAAAGTQDTAGTIADYDQPVGQPAGAGYATGEYAGWATPGTGPPTTPEYGTPPAAPEYGGQPYGGEQPPSDAGTATTSVLSDIGETGTPPAAPPPAAPPPAAPPPAAAPPATPTAEQPAVDQPAADQPPTGEPDDPYRGSSND